MAIIMLGKMMIKRPYEGAKCYVLVVRGAVPPPTECAIAGYKGKAMHNVGVLETIARPT